MFNKLLKIFLHILSGIFLLSTVTGCTQKTLQNEASPLPASDTNQVQSSQPITPSPTGLLTAPISHALERVTKKSLGTKVSPQNSPVTPEKFSGYHTGVDFETFPDEQNIDVPIYVVCTGPLLRKEVVSGYGGIAVQQCTLENQTVTVLYGHLKLTSITVQGGKILNAGEQLGILGKGYSSETSGERKHLHLGIHKGPSINIRGYVNNPSELDAWLDVTKYLSR